jgi:HD superfamily phosphohydrolase
MSSGAVCVTLLKTKRVVKDFQEEKGFASLSETLRFIIEDYFRLRNKLDESRNADFERVCDLIAGKGADDFNKEVIEDLGYLKDSVTEIRNMIALVSQIDPKWLEQFRQYFPKYFK